MKPETISQGGPTGQLWRIHCLPGQGMNTVILQGMHHSARAGNERKKARTPQDIPEHPGRTGEWFNQQDGCRLADKPPFAPLDENGLFQPGRMSLVDHLQWAVSFP